ARRPDAHRRVRSLRGEHHRKHLLLDELPGRRIAEEARHVDEDGVEEDGELLGVDLEVVAVGLEAGDADGLHAAQHSPHQARALVAGEIEAALLLQEAQQVLEALLLRRAHDGLLLTRVCRAGAISCSGSTKSTMPVCCAASGMPPNSELSWSCTITVPPIFLIAFTPIAPSVPEPESTTAIARSRKAAAVDSNSRSAEGRTKCTSSVCVSVSDPSGLTSRRLFGGAIITVPAATLSPCRASFTLRPVRRPRMSAMRLRWRGARCWPTTMPAAKSAGRACKTWVRAFSPPADAARATMSKLLIHSAYAEVEHFRL